MGAACGLSAVLFYSQRTCIAAGNAIGLFSGTETGILPARAARETTCSRHSLPALTTAGAARREKLPRPPDRYAARFWGIIRAMNTLFPEEEGQVKYGSDYKPLNGEIMVTLNAKRNIDCILRFENGRLHGDNAVETTTGYQEKWERGIFVAVDLGWNKRQPKRTVFPPQDREGKLDRIRRAFERRGKADPTRFLPVLGEETYLPGFELPDFGDFDDGD